MMASPRFLPFVITIAVLLSILVICLVLFIVKYIHATKHKSFSSKSVVLVISCSICYMLTMGFLIVYDHHTTSNRIGITSDILQITFWHIGNVLMYIYLLSRMYSGFKNTKYQVNITILVILVVCVLIYFLLALMLFCLGIWASVIGSEIYDNNFFIDSVLIIKIGTLVQDIVISISILIIFIYKLYSVGKSAYKSKSIQMTEVQRNITNETDSFDDESQYNHTYTKEELKQDKIFVAMSKITVLSIVIIILNHLTMILSVVSWIHTDKSWKHYNPKSEMITEYTYNSFKVIDCFVSSLCLYMGFFFTNNWYFIFCRCFDEHVQAMFINKMHRDVIHSIPK